MEGQKGSLDQWGLVSGAECFQFNFIIIIIACCYYYLLLLLCFIIMDLLLLLLVVCPLVPLLVLVKYAVV